MKTKPFQERVYKSIIIQPWQRLSPLDYFWDFHGPNPNPTTGYQADY